MCEFVSHLSLETFILSKLDDKKGKSAYLQDVDVFRSDDGQLTENRRNLAVNSQLEK